MRNLSEWLTQKTSALLTHLRDCREIRQSLWRLSEQPQRKDIREYSIRRAAKRKDYRLAKHVDESYRLINERLNVIVCHLDGAPLKTIASFYGDARKSGNIRQYTSSMDNMRESVAWCLAHGCDRLRDLDVSVYPDSVLVPPFGPRPRCEFCGHLGADARPHWNEVTPQCRLGYCAGSRPQFQPLQCAARLP